MVRPNTVQQEVFNPSTLFSSFETAKRDHPAINSPGYVSEVEEIFNNINFQTKYQDDLQTKYQDNFKNKLQDDFFSKHQDDFRNKYKADFHTEYQADFQTKNQDDFFRKQ